MDEREKARAQQEALGEKAGTAGEETRKRIRTGLEKYLAAEARHESKAARDEQERDRQARARRDRR